jgi:ankyrin repeat protein
MAERSRWLGPLALLLLGLALAWLPTWIGSPLALAGLVLAQPALLLGWSGWRGSRDLAQPRFPLLVDAASVAILWTLAFALLAVIVAWPLKALLDNGALVPALVLSLCVGFVLLGLWRLWPAFAQAARHGQSFAGLLSAATRGGGNELGRGLAITMLVFAVLALGLILVWPGIVVGGVRPMLLLGYPLLSLLAHVEIHRRADRLPGAQMAAAPATPVIEPGPRQSGVADEPLAGTPDERLYAALRAGRIEAGLEALAAGANAHSLPAEDDRDQRTLSMLASLQGDLRVLRQLIARGVDLNQQHGGLTALLAATRDSWHGRPEAVMTLLANGADARLADNEGNTPLHHAARSTDPAVAALLLDAGAQVDTLNNEGVSPLGIACASGNWRLARFLIEHGARPEPAGGQPALLAAVAGDDDPGGAQLLLRHKARVDARGPAQRTALMQACAAGNPEIVALLLDAGADRNAQDALGMTPLLDAAGHGHTAVVARLAAAKPNVQAVDEHQRNALLLACLGGAEPELLSQLMRMGVDPEKPDDQGRRAIDVAIEHGRWLQVAVLDPNYALPANVAEAMADGGRDRTPRELLREALTEQKLDAAASVIGLGGGIGPDTLAELLLEFCADDKLAAFDWLCRHGAPADLNRYELDSVLFQLFDRGGARQLALQHLLDRGQAIGGRGGLARFLSACQSGEHTSRGAEQMALSLLERGADGFGMPANQDPPLITAIRLGWQRLVEALLAQGIDPNQRDARGHGAIHVAAGLGREAALRVLIRYGALPQTRSPDGQTALGIALAAGRSDLSHWLEWRGWALPGRPLQPVDLPAAAIAGDLDAVQRLLDLGLPVDAADPQGCTALLRAAGGGHLEIARRLLELGADKQLSARTGATPLSAAISMRHAAVVELLLQTGANPNQTLPGGVTPLMLAAALGLPEIAGRLLSQGAAVDAVDDQGLSALHCAALHAFTARDRQRVLALFDLLLLADLAPDAANASGHTPLLLVLGARAEAGAACDEDVLLAVLERLFNEGVSLDVQDQRGLGALHLAAMHGLLSVVQRLLREGANRLLRDTLGRTAYDLALLRGYVDIAAEFEPARPSPSLARFLRDPR